MYTWILELNMNLVVYKIQRSAEMKLPHKIMPFNRYLKLYYYVTFKFPYSGFLIIVQNFNMMNS